MADPSITWYMNLEGLDKDNAVFNHIPPGKLPDDGTAALIVRRDQWEILGRPGKIEVIVMKDEG